MAPIKRKFKEDIRNRICQFRKKHSNKPKIFTVKHFLDEGVLKSTIYRVLDCALDNLDPTRKKGIGRVAKIMDKYRI